MTADQLAACHFRIARRRLSTAETLAAIEAIHAEHHAAEAMVEREIRSAAVADYNRGRDVEAAITSNVGRIGHAVCAFEEGL